MAESTSESAPPRLRQQYQDTIAPKLQEEFGYKNVNQIPRVEKVVVNVGFG